MVHAQQRASGDEAKALRKKGGAYIKSLREKAALTQRELAQRLGLEYYTFISQVEGGFARIPPDLYEAYARNLGVDVAEFVRELLKYYDPFTYRALFAKRKDGRA